MNRPLLLLSLLISLTAPAHAAGLSGLWRIDGKLPDGTKLRGVAALSPDADGAADRYRIVAFAQLGDGRKITWRAVARRDGPTLAVRHVGVSGLAQRIVVVHKPPAILAAYKLSQDETTFAGRYHLERSAKGAWLRYRREPKPKILPSPRQLSVRVGNQAVLRLRCDPAIALPLLGVDGEGVGKITTDKGQRVVTLEPTRTGQHSLRVRLGAGGPALLEIPMRVLPSYIDAVRERILKIRGKDRTPLVVFDVDDTLFDSRYRTRDLLQAFGSEAKEPRLTGITLAQVRARIRDTLSAAGLSAAELDGDLGQRAVAAWGEKFPDPSFYAFDRPFKGAARAAVAFSEAGARIVYVTERFRRGLGATRAQLNEAGFPDGAIVCKPTKQQAPAFKELTVAELNRVQGTVAACFENDPANLNAIKRACPDALVFRVVGLLAPDAPKLEGGIELLRRY